MMRSVLNGAALTAAIMAGSALASAQTPVQSPAGGGPMTVEAIHSDWVIGPEAKVTRFDGQTDVMAGVSGGRLFDEKLLVGGAGYWLGDSNRLHELGYGGVVLEWREGADRAIGYSLRGLFGFGTATVSADSFFYGRRALLMPTRLAYRRDFLLAEPEADLLVSVAPHVKVRAGVGYRASGNTEGLGDRISGATGIVSLEFSTASRHP